MKTLVEEFFQWDAKPRAAPPYIREFLERLRRKSAQPYDIDGLPLSELASLPKCAWSLAEERWLQKGRTVSDCRIGFQGMQEFRARLGKFSLCSSKLKKIRETREPLQRSADQAVRLFLTAIMVP